MNKACLFILLFGFFLAGALSFGTGQAEETGPVQLIYWTHEDPNRTPLEEQLIA